MEYNHTIIKDFESYLNQIGRRPAAIRMYIRKIMNFLENGYSVADLIGSLARNIKSHSVGGNKYNPKDHNNTTAALLNFAEFILTLEGYNDLYITYNPGWSSFRPVNEFISGYTIQGRQFFVSFDKGFTKSRAAHKVIKRRDFVFFALFLRENKSYLSDSNTSIKTVHGPLANYTYDIASKTGANCNSLFAARSSSDESYVNDIMKEYNDFIEKFDY